MFNAKSEAFKYLKNPYVIAIIVLRLSGYIFMLFKPFEGMVLSFLFDVLDWEILSISGLPYRRIYHEYDKPLDYLQYIFLIPILYNTSIFLPYLLFLIWRTIGHLVYHRTHNRKYFVIFPNIAEYIAFVYFLDLRLDINIYPLLPLPFATILIFKLIQEIFLHYEIVARFLPQSTVHDWGKAVRRLFMAKESKM